MKRVLLACLFLLLASQARADWDEYDARPGLIPIGGLIVFFNSQGPLSYPTLTPKEIPSDAVNIGTVRCKSCQHGLSIPITTPSSSSRSTNLSGAQGDGSFKKALAQLQKDRPELKGIYDVKVDMHRISVLGIYKRLCTEVTARGFK